MAHDIGMRTGMHSDSLLSYCPARRSVSLLLYLSHSILQSSLCLICCLQSWLPINLNSIMTNGTRHRHAHRHAQRLPTVLLSCTSLSQSVTVSESQHRAIISVPHLLSAVMAAYQ